jgi:hypothetical protein
MPGFFAFESRDNQVIAGQGTVSERESHQNVHRFEAFKGKGHVSPDLQASLRQREFHSQQASELSLRA